MPKPDKTTYVISRFLDTVGDGSGIKPALGDYSVTPEEFIIAPPTGVMFTITTMLVALAGSSALSAKKYGSSVALTNGVEMFVRRGSYTGYTLYNLIDPTFRVKTNAGWGFYCYDAGVNNYGVGPTDYLSARWMFTNSGMPIVLLGYLQDQLVVRLSDDFSGLTQHVFFVQGFKETE